jgi:hypothetical protein
MSEHIEDYSHLVQQVELRHGIDRKGAPDADKQETSHAFLSGANQFTIDFMTVSLR